MRAKDIQFPFINIERVFPEHFDTLPGQTVRDRGVEQSSYDRSPASFAECVSLVHPLTLRGLLKMRDRGWVTPTWADRIAVANRLHPTAIWPEEWLHYLELSLAEHEAEVEATRQRTIAWRQREAAKQDEAERMPY